MTEIEITLFGIVVGAITGILANIALEVIRNRNVRELQKKKLVWDLKVPIYMSLAEELEDLFVQEGQAPANIPEREKKFNKVCNKIFLVASDNVIREINSVSGGENAVPQIGSILVALRKELELDTELTNADYLRKNLSNQRNDQ